MRFVLTILASLMALPAAAIELNAPFENIDGGTLKLSDWAGQPVLVVNTASRCGFTDQYEGLQTLYDRYRDRGLVVLAVPSGDFRQELASNEEVKDFCELTYGIDMPMTGITSVRGAAAHPFYASVAEEVGFTPAWNFSKILVAPDGTIKATFGSTVKPLSSTLTDEIEPLLN
ncbi:MAG: glutathione peroxidase [Roseovarius sp.]